jgi:hypothetical protein
MVYAVSVITPFYRLKLPEAVNRNPDRHAEDPPKRHLVRLLCPTQDGLMNGRFS